MPAAPAGRRATGTVIANARIGSLNRSKLSKVTKVAMTAPRVETIHVAWVNDSTLETAAIGMVAWGELQQVTTSPRYRYLD